MTRNRALSSVCVALLLAGAACRSGRRSIDLSNPETQRRYGVKMAKLSLWREAMFRFQRAVEIDPRDAMAHNNLAVAYEANGDFDNAGKEYREALRLDRSNQYIQKNYSRYVEFTQRSKKRSGAAAEATPSATKSTPPAATDTAKPEPPMTPATPPAAAAPPSTTTDSDDNPPLLPPPPPPAKGSR